MRRLLIAAAVLWLAVPASAQQLVSGDLRATSDTVTAFIPANTPSLAIQVSGTWTGTITFQVSADGVTFVSLLSSNVTTGTPATSTTANGIFAAGKVGAVVRAFGTSIASGTAVVTIVQGGGGGGGGGGTVSGSGTYGTPGTTPLTTQICDNDSCLAVSSGAASTVLLNNNYFDNAAGFTAGSSGVLVSGGVYQSSPTTLTDGRPAAFLLSSNRVLATYLANPTTGAASPIATDVTLGTTTYTEASSTAPGLAVRNDTPDALVGTTNEFTPLGVSQNGALWTATIDPCSYKTKTYYVVNLAATGTVEIANAVANEFWYICAVNIVAQGANAVLIAHDDTDGCGSITAGMNGGTTAATGWGFAANGGISLGNGAGTVLKSATANHYLCIAPSTNAQISGTIAYVSAP